MKNFIDLVVDLAKDSKLADEFHNKIADSDPAVMSDFFKEKGYDVSKEECSKIVDNKEDLKSSKVGFFY